MRVDMVLGDGVTEYARSLQVGCEQMFRRKAFLKKTLLADFEAYRDANFPGFEGEPEIRFHDDAFLTPQRRDGAPLTPDDVEAVERYYTALALDLDSTLPEHMAMKWEKNRRVVWSVVVPNHLIIFRQESK